MTLTSTANRTQFAGDDSTTAFAISWVFYDKDDLLVTHTVTATGVETAYVRGNQYTVTGGAGSTGTVTTKSGSTAATGETLTVTSEVPNTQPLDLAVGGAFPSNSVEQQLDKLARLVQQTTEKLGRALKFPIHLTQTDIALPTPSAGLVLGWNSGATAIENITLTSTSLSDPLLVANGGTAGATTTAARDNLGINTSRRLSLYRHL